MKRNSKILAMCGLLTISASLSAQDYYGGGNGSWRRQPSNNTQQKDKDKDDSPSEPSGYLSINYGAALPEGSFSQPISQGTYSQAFGEGYGNYAQPGSVFHFSLGIPIKHSNFGVAFMLGNYANNYDINSYSNNLYSENIPNPYANSAMGDYEAVPGQQNFYSATSIMGGLFTTYPIGRLSLDGRFMIGALLTDLPEQAVYAADASENEFELDTQPSNSTSFAVDAGVGLRFMIAQFGRRKLCLMVNADFLYSSISYNTQQYLYVVPATGTYAGQQVQLTNTNGSSPSVTGTMPFEMLNITFGIGYQL